jgi:1-acyl-sn-glycerol-3-phosphate acyltransferase
MEPNFLRQFRARDAADRVKEGGSEDGKGQMPPASGRLPAAVSEHLRGSGQAAMWALIVAGLVLAGVLVRWRRSGLGALDYFGVGVIRAYARLWHRWSSSGPPLLPPGGGAIVVANHTAATDPAFVAAGCGRAPSFLIAREYYEIPLFRPLFEQMECVPVARQGYDICALRLALRRLREGRLVCIFPEGGLSNAGRFRPRPGKAGVALLALRSRAPVIPAYVAGGPHTSDVVPAWLRPSRVHVVFGPPVDLSAYYGRPIDRKLLEEVTALLMCRVAGLAAGPKAARFCEPRPNSSHSNKGGRHGRRKRTDPQALPALRGRRPATFHR